MEVFAGGNAFNIWIGGIKWSCEEIAEQVATTLDFVDKINPQTIDGIKTFTDDIICPNLVTLGTSQTISGAKTFTASNNFKQDTSGQNTQVLTNNDATNNNSTAL